jgi:hypothetical protein
MNRITFIYKIAILVILFFVLDYLISCGLIIGLNKYYGFHQKPEVLINGTSIAMSGFNRRDIEGRTSLRTASYSHEGVSVDERFEMIDHFFQENPNSVKVVIYEVNPVIFSVNKIADNVYTIFYPYMDNKSIDKFVNERAGKKEYYIHKLVRTSRFDSRLLRLVVSGYSGNYNNLKKNRLDTASLVQLIALKDKSQVIMDSQKIKVFGNTMDLIIANNSRILLVMMPMYYHKLQTFNSTELEGLNKYFERFSKAHKDITFLNLNQDSLVRDANLFSDPLHFNLYGQQKISGIISSYLTNE